MGRYFVTMQKPVPWIGSNEYQDQQRNLGLMPVTNLPRNWQGRRKEEEEREENF